MSEPEVRRKILVVDDEPGVRITLAANLELHGYDVVTASDGDEAIECVKKERFDLVVCDIRMPRLNGVEAFQHLREAQPGIQVVFITGFEVEDLIKRAIAEGAYTVLHKPLAMERLLSVVELALEYPVVLVVDDSEPFANSISAALGESGQRAQPVFSGEDALTAINDAKVDVVVLDLVMPGIDGVETFLRLRQVDPRVRVIAVTGHDVADLIQAVMSHGAYKCLKKPFDVAALIQVIAKARGEQLSR